MFACCADASTNDAVLVESLNKNDPLPTPPKKEPEPEKSSVEEDPPAPPPPAPEPEPKPEPVKEEPPPTNAPEPTPAPAPEPTPAPAPAPAAEPPGLAVVFATLKSVNANVSFMKSIEMADSDLVKRETITLQFKSKMQLKFSEGFSNASGGSCSPLCVQGVALGSEAHTLGVTKGWNILKIGDISVEKMQETEAIKVYREASSKLK